SQTLSSVMYELIEVLNKEHDITVVTIEHHAEFIAQFAKSVVLMHQGTPVWHLPVQEAVNRSAELEEHGIPAPQVVQAVQALGHDQAPRTVRDAATLLGAQLLPSGLLSQPIQLLNNNS